MPVGQGHEFEVENVCEGILKTVGVKYQYSKKCLFFKMLNIQLHFNFI